MEDVTVRRLCEVKYNGTANNMIWSYWWAPATAARQRRNGCDNELETWWVGSRTQWNVTKDFYMGVDVLYSKIQTATLGNFAFAGMGTLPAAFGRPVPLFRGRPGQRDGPLPRPSRLLSLIG